MDACILNVSSRGMMVRTGQPAQHGTVIEIRRDNHVITGRVVWHGNGTLGLQSEQHLPVADILSLGASSSLRLAASDGDLIDRRRHSRERWQQSRHRSRSLQFLGVLAIAGGLSISGALWVRAMLTAPLQAAEAMLGP